MASDGARRKLLVVTALLLAPAALAAPGIASVPCDPEPVGRCGAHQRETVVHCYSGDSDPKARRWYSPTDAHVITVAEPLPSVPIPDVSRIPPGIPQVQPPPPPVLYTDEGTRSGLLYLRKAPAEGFLADPYESRLPNESLYRESNYFVGVQPGDFFCAEFQWWAECEPPQWMEFNPIRKKADEKMY